MKIILASASPRRKKLLGLIVPEFDIIESKSDELLNNNLSPEEQASYLASIKAKEVFSRTQGDRIVIGADTIVTKNNKIYGKPKNNEHAKQMIKELLQDGGIHSVITGLCIIMETNGEKKEYVTYDEVKVFLKNITDEEIEKWIATGKAIDKAGSYGIQNEFGVFVDKIEGNYTTVVGLPIHKVYEIIKNYI